MTTALVTGGAGFIGSHLCEALLAHGRRVIVLDDLSSGSRSNLAPVAEGVHFIQADVRNLLDHADGLREVTEIYHLASLISSQDSLRDPDRYLDVNLHGLLRVIDLAVMLGGAPKIVFASSSTVYGNADRPLRSESDPLQPETVYAATKAMGEHLLRIYGESHGVQSVSLRLFNVYGPRQSPDHAYANVACKFAYAAARGGPAWVVGSGEQKRDFVYVTDVVDVMLALAEASAASVYNIGTGLSTSISDLLDLALSAGDRSGVEVHRAEPWPNDIYDIQADLTRLRDEKGSVAFTPLADGIRETVRIFRDEP